MREFGPVYSPKRDCAVIEKLSAHPHTHLRRRSAAICSQELTLEPVPSNIVKEASMSKSIFLFNLLICCFISGVTSAGEPSGDDRPVALITGSSYGLGAELTQLAVARGWRVALVDVRPGPSIEMAEEIRASGGIATFYEVDLAVPAKRAGLVRQVVDEFGRIDYLFNNAGYAYLATLEEMDMAAAHHLFEVNYWAYADLAQQALPLMRAQGRGTVVNVSSILGMRGGSMGYGHYAATKHALHGLFQSTMKEVADAGIHIIVAAPGGMRTQVGKHSVGPMADPTNDRAAQWEDPAIAAQDIFDQLEKGSAIINPGYVGRLQD